ncbi:MAG: hypothetical protein COS99_00335 [Candidatus Omnitrophica bacterium CG07_land_8_20_14_0_80_42_15]|uniref:Uncharacterized protein n=1 Tax=Candidatus Aquitaenariimonas noxiae TaxID=1974741 RepID=A0A2J0KV97_9BACT|nr:MAG: hypothetical protein COS99_00335 [Candidatus Omnitrophica bacterium CG07_land_8_20_14_0_80_42_15]
MIQNQNGLNKIVIVIMIGIFLCMLTGWGLYTLFSQKLIIAMYNGNSIGVLNKVINKNLEMPPPVEYYLERASLSFFQFNSICVLLLISCIRIILRQGGGRIKNLCRRSSTVLIYLIVALIILNSFMGKWGVGSYGKMPPCNNSIPTYTLFGMLDRTAEKPWIYRILMPTIVNLTTSLIPEEVLISKKEFFTKNSPLIKYIKTKGNWELKPIVKYHVVYIYLYLC